MGNHPPAHSALAVGLIDGLGRTSLSGYRDVSRGLLSRRRQGWRDTRPPRLLVGGAVVLPALMWVPIGGFAVGYLTIIVLFAGFYGMLERFSPGAFVGAGPGITDWVSFAFFAGLGQDFTTVAPVAPAVNGAIPGNQVKVVSGGGGPCGLRSILDLHCRTLRNPE